MYRNVFKRELTLHKYTFDKTTGVLKIKCSDYADREFLIMDIERLAYNMDFVNYDVIMELDNKTLTIGITNA
jgi:hypothetical protein